jgi:D-glycero-D-manno-heptose 1,7-bisphosphate phosphatase
MSRACLFLDRDGVINEPAAEGEYINHWSDFRFLPAAADWIRLFNALDYLVIVITNQRGIALGHTNPAELDEIHRNMVRELARVGARIDDVFCCPHNYGECNCRKPQPGLIDQAVEKWDIDLQRSLFIGDSKLDEDLARNCGIRFLRASGNGHIVPEVGS